MNLLARLGSWLTWMDSEPGRKHVRTREESDRAPRIKKDKEG